MALRPNITTASQFREAIQNAIRGQGVASIADNADVPNLNSEEGTVQYNFTLTDVNAVPAAVRNAFRIGFRSAFEPSIPSADNAEAGTVTSNITADVNDLESSFWVTPIKLVRFLLACASSTQANGVYMRLAKKDIDGSERFSAPIYFPLTESQFQGSVRDRLMNNVPLTGYEGFIMFINKASPFVANTHQLTLWGRLAPPQVVRVSDVSGFV